MTKPISITELKAKLKAVAFRWQHSQRQIRRLHRQTLNAAAVVAATAGAPTTVTEGEEGPQEVHAGQAIHLSKSLPTAASLLYATPSPQMTTRQIDSEPQANHQ